MSQPAIPRVKPSRQLHEHTCWVDRCSVQPPCVATTDPRYCHSFSQPARSVAVENRKVMSCTCERWLYACYNGLGGCCTTPSLCHLPGMQLSETRLQLSPIPFPSAVQLWLIKLFLEAARGHFSDVLIISHVLTWTSFCSLICFIASGAWDTSTHTLAHPFMVTQSDPTYWGRSNERVGGHTADILFLTFK